MLPDRMLVQSFDKIVQFLYPHSTTWRARRNCQSRSNGRTLAVLLLTASRKITAAQQGIKAKEHSEDFLAITFETAGVPKRSSHQMLSFSRGIVGCGRFWIWAWL